MWAFVNGGLHLFCVCLMLLFGLWVCLWVFYVCELALTLGICFTLVFWAFDLGLLCVLWLDLCFVVWFV